LFLDKNKIVDRITSKYSNLNDLAKIELLENARVLKLPKGTTLVKEGQLSDKTFFIIKGCARAYYLKEGKDISDWFAFEDEFISSINSFFLNVPSPHYIEVLEDSILLEISRNDVEKLSEKYHDFERLTKVIVTKTMLQQQQRIVSMQFYTAEEKYKNLLSIRKDITNRVPLTHIASYIGITLETLSRIRNMAVRI
jgi:CRP-like cAMP-binding protein